ncbi:hypothetical protein CXF61_01330 [Psychrobacter sp. 4Dc]|nr:hypothetical protein CXF61_01330 [Psychrobacter sp. 4Dc]
MGSIHGEVLNTKKINSILKKPFKYTEKYPSTTAIIQNLATITLQPKVQVLTKLPNQSKHLINSP